MLDKLVLLPAIDIAGGQTVRITGSEIDSESFESPITVAHSFVAAGADWIHLVDLDAAYAKGFNRELISQVVSATPAVKIELSGGIKDDESLAFAISSGAARVNLGTGALEKIDWIEQVITSYGDRIVIGLDYRGTTLAARGENALGSDLFETVRRLDQLGCFRYILTDVTKDGMLQGPNISTLKQVLEITDRPVIASGGIASLEDISQLRALVGDGLEGAILGKALYAQKFTLAQALAIAGY